MPQTKKVKGKIENAYGKPLPIALDYEGEYEELLPSDEIPAKEAPDAEDILSLVNNKRKASARQKFMQKTLDDNNVPKPTLKDPDVQFRDMVKILVAAGRSEADARQMANSNLGTNYTDAFVIKLS